MSLYPGKMVLYRWRPGEVRAGNVDAAAMITRIYPDQSLDLTVYPAMDRDPRFQIKVPPMSEKAQFHCWHRNEDDKRTDALEARIAELEVALDRANINTASRNAEMEANRSAAIAGERKRASRTKAIVETT